jgi:hypothetical protein
MPLQISHGALVVAMQTASLAQQFGYWHKILNQYSLTGSISSGDFELLGKAQTAGKMLALWTVGLPLHRLGDYRDGVWLGDEVTKVDGGWIGN